MRDATPDISVVIPVFRDGRRARAAAEAISRQSGVTVEVVVVDDGSDDDTPEWLSQETGWRLIRLPANQGRSVARNAGARAARAAHIVFMDCDCVPTAVNFLLMHLNALRGGAAATTGHVTGVGGGFWDRYQRSASARRRLQHARGFPAAGSSQNLGVSRDAFLAVSAFDTAYAQYGFEDRDLLMRLAARGPVVWVDACVEHQDRLDLPGVTKKLREAGRHSAGRFAQAYPAAYRRLGYSALDATLHPWLRPLAAVTGPCIMTWARMADRLLHRRWLPFRVRAGMVKAICAAAFMAGTADRAGQRGYAP